MVGSMDHLLLRRITPGRHGVYSLELVPRFRDAHCDEFHLPGPPRTNFHGISLDEYITILLQRGELSSNRANIRTDGPCRNTFTLLLLPTAPPRSALGASNVFTINVPLSIPCFPVGGTDIREAGHSRRARAPAGTRDVGPGREPKITRWWGLSI